MSTTPPTGTASDDEVLFAFEGVTVHGDRGDRLAEVTTTIPGGGITCLLGPSGAGKSTLLRLCNRLEVPDEGRVSYRGRSLSDADPLHLRRDVGMVFQRPTVFAGTVRDNLEVAAPDADDDRYRQALQRADLAPSFLDADAKELSGGEQQRVCVARTLITEPDVLLMDEPTSALDPTSRLTLERLARRLADGGVPIVWVTHDLEQAERIADHVLVLRAGRVVQTGTLDRIREEPATPGVAAFLEGRDDDVEQGAPDVQHPGGRDDGEGRGAPDVEHREGREDDEEAGT